LVEIGQVRAVGRVVTVIREAILIEVFRLGWYRKVKDEKKKKNGEIHCVFSLSLVLEFRERE
jgi:5-formaminoimidazole-4-carboxamide-1-beta-D-ribofuranosyl 5'-monophosphate synthetase